MDFDDLDADLERIARQFDETAAPPLAPVAEKALRRYTCVYSAPRPDKSVARAG